MNARPVQLVSSTGHPRADEILRGFVSLFETLFPGRLRSYYLVGSYRSRLSGAASDLDLHILARNDLGISEGSAMRKVGEACSRISSIPLDLLFMGEDEALRLGNVVLKKEGMLLYGEDLLDRMPWTPFELHLRRVTHNAWRTSAWIRRRDRLVFPLTCPDPKGDFLGYDSLTLRTVDGSEMRALKGLLGCVFPPAKALIMAAARDFCGDRQESLGLYRAHVGDGWCDHMEELYESCRVRWGYAVPSGETERRRLRFLCERTLEFENHFLTIYGEFLLADMTLEQDATLWLTPAQAVQILGLKPGALHARIARGQFEIQRENGLRRLRFDDLFKLLAARMAGRVLFPGDDRFPAALEGLAGSTNPLLAHSARESLRSLAILRRSASL